MSHKHYRFLAMLPLMAILGSSPDYLMNSRYASRTLAMEYEYPLYAAKVSTLNPESIYTNEHLDVTGFTMKADMFRKELMEFRGSFDAKELDEAKLKLQNNKVESLVISMYLLDLDQSGISKRGLLGEPSHRATVEGIVRELKMTVESLLVDQKENEKLILAEKTKKEEEQKKKDEALKLEQERIAAEKAAEEQKKKDELARQEAEQKQCEELEAKNKTLTEQVETLVSDNKKIMEQMMAMMQMMTGMYNQVYLPYLSGPSVVQQYNLPHSLQGTDGNWVYVPNGTSQQTFQDYMGSTNYQQEQQQRFNPTYFTAPQFMPTQPTFTPMNYEAGNFGQSNEVYNFGKTAYNIDFQKIFNQPI